MKSFVGTFILIAIAGAIAHSKQPQQNTAKTEIPGAGPCTNIPARYERLDVRIAWFYGCMHKDPPSVAEIKAKIAALPPERQKAFVNQDFATQEALYGVAFYDLPIQVFPPK